MLSEIERRWDPDYFLEKADDALEGVTLGEGKAWGDHPCTKYLQNTLKASVAILVQGWARGDYTDPSSSGTFQKNAKAVGELQAVENVLDIVDLLIRDALTGEKND